VEGKFNEFNDLAYDLMLEMTEGPSPFLEIRHTEEKVDAKRQDAKKVIQPYEDETTREAVEYIMFGSPIE